MRAILMSLLLLLPTTTAQAMNWEGHDDWMTTMEPAVAYENAVPHASPRGPRSCAATAGDAKDNPYEQIPLDQDRCAPENNGTGR